MNRDTIFTVTNEHLNKLDLNTAVEFFRNLLRAEAYKSGIELSKISVSSWVNVPDGGVDATVDDAQIAKPELIKLGKTSYQIKSGAEFKPWQESVIKKALFGERTPELQNLGQSIRACLDAEGTYVLVCTGIDPVVPQREKILSNIVEYLKQCGYSQPKVEVFTQNTLIGFLQAFPSLALSLRGLHEESFRTHQRWARDENMKVEFVRGPKQSELIQDIQNDLRRHDYPVHVRVWGEPGIGKTRLVLEATKAEDLSPLVIYCRTASQFESSSLMNAICRDDNLSAIVVIDECNPDSRARIWNELRHYSPRIKPITIYNDYEEIPGDITYHVIPPLEHEQIRNIIIQEHYKESPAPGDQWVELCSGSPRVAHVIGWNLVNHPEDVLKPPSTVNIWERYIAAGDAPQSEKTEQRRLVLQYLSLFKRFGYETPVGDEAKSIAEMIKMANPQITWDRFQDIIYELRERRILQGDFTLYITPKALHIKLWSQWWERRGSGFDFETFCQDLTPKLVEWFYEMFQYAAESDAASSIVKELLGPNGPFRDDEYLKTRLGSRFFSALTEANPRYALKCLMRIIGTSDKETLLQFTDGRRYVVWALERIAMRRELFADAARLLLALGEAENEGSSNNASGVFAALFSPGPGRIASTEAHPAERLPILKEAFESHSKERRVLALKACDAALEAEHFPRTTSAKFQALQKPPDLWQPKTYGELWDAYRHVWQLLSEQLALLPKDEREVAIGILIERAAHLAKSPNLTDIVLNTLRLLSEKIYVDNRLLIKTVVEFLHYNGEDLTDDMRHRWEQFRDELIGSDFNALMLRYVGTNLLVDAFDENENYFEEGHPQIRTLAQQAIEEPHLLQSELQWLVTAEAHNGYAFGYQLGKEDDGFVILPMLLEAQRNASENANAFFLGGYFRALFEIDTAKWEKQLDALIEDNTLNLLIPELTHRSGLTDRAGLRLLHLAKEGIIDINRFDIFTYSRAIENLSEAVFTAWIEFLLNVSEKSAVSIALCLCHRYYVGKKPNPTLPADRTFQLLTHPSFFEESDENRFRTMTEHYWIELGKALLQRYPKKCLGLVELMLAHFGTKGTIVPGFKAKTTLLLTEVMKKYPERVWKRVSKYIEASIETSSNFSRSIALERWLQAAELSKTEKGAITLIPHKKIWEWIDEDVENRASVLARRFVPKTLIETEWQTSLARTMLTRYGEREDVRHALISNYLEGVGVGPASLRYDTIKQKLLHIKNTENDGNVIRWLDEYIATLEDLIKQAKIDEERMF